MIYLFYGEDSYSQKEFIKSIEEQVGVSEMKEANISRYVAQETSQEALISACMTIPFLAKKRLIIVLGLWEYSKGKFSNKKKQSNKKNNSDSKAEWADFWNTVEQIPDTTDIIFSEYNYAPPKNAIMDLSENWIVREFPRMEEYALTQWIRKKTTDQQVEINTSAIKLFVELIGSDLWELSNELEKLILYTNGQTISVDHVNKLISTTKNINVFEAINALFDGNIQRSFQLINILLDDEYEARDFRFLLTRQTRQLILVKSLLEEKLSAEEIGKTLSISSSYAIKKTIERARNISWSRIKRFHKQLIETDRAIKTSELEERIALETFIAEMCVTS
jgi:DNA polymerase-3 subunit delta